MTAAVRSFQPSDSEAARKLLNVSWPGEQRAADDLSTVLEGEGTLLGVGRVLPLNVIHPYARTLDAALSGSFPAVTQPGCIKH